MSINGIQLAKSNLSFNQPAFNGGKIDDVKIKEYPDHIEKRTLVKPSTGKKWGVGIASLLVSGLGQFVNGDIEKGVLFLAGEIGAWIAPKVFKVRIASRVLLPAVKIWSAIDAVKNAKSTVVSVVDKK